MEEENKELNNEPKKKEDVVGPLIGSIVIILIIILGGFYMWTLIQERLAEPLENNNQPEQLDETLGDIVENSPEN